MDTDGKVRARANFEEAFGFSGYETRQPVAGIRARGSYDEDIRLAPYTYNGASRARAPSSDRSTASSGPQQLYNPHAPEVGVAV